MVRATRSTAVWMSWASIGRLEHVLDAGPEGPLEQVGAELVGDHDGGHLPAGGEQLLGRGELDGVVEGGAEDGHQRVAVQGGAELVDRGVARGAGSDQHHQAGADGLVGADHGDDGASCATATEAGIDLGLTLTWVAGEGTVHGDSLQSWLPWGPYGVSSPLSPGRVATAGSIGGRGFGT